MKLATALSEQKLHDDEVVISIEQSLATNLSSAEQELAVSTFQQNIPIPSKPAAAISSRSTRSTQPAAAAAISSRSTRSTRDTTNVSTLISQMFESGFFSKDLLSTNDVRTITETVTDHILFMLHKSELTAEQAELIHECVREIA
jgi:hypothetical protein